MTRKGPRAGIAVEVAASMADIERQDWDAIANPPGRPFDPFLSYDFLASLEASGSIAPDTGWQPQHLLLRDAGGRLAGAMPLYLKGHSLGEFVFDHGWADAYERHGLPYYPKLLSAVPVTPVPGRRLIVAEGPEAAGREEILASAAVTLTRDRWQASSLHVTFLTAPECARLVALGFLKRTGHQFHWLNDGFSSFEDFLDTLASRKRKALRRERRDALAAGIEIEWLTGRDITEAHWDVFFEFYMDTGSRKWGSPYLNRQFFSLIGEAMADRCLLVMARRSGRYIAGALNMIGGEALYGRYWGCLEQHPFLHFEICYYQAIDFAIAHRLARVEAGAGGEHKLVRGYMPVETTSAHWIADPRFRKAIENYLVAERAHVAHESEALESFAPFRKGERS
ncbi:MAG: GNAT family N-acetyltransferase [Hyphomicrobiaceae bacterium]